MESKVTIDVKNFMKLAELTKCELKVIAELLLRVNKEGMYKELIILNGGVKRDIIESLGIKGTSLNNSLTLLCKKNVLIRVDTSMFKINNEILELEIN